MAEPKFGTQILTLDEANLLLPLVRQELLRLRELRRQIVAWQALVDVEEMTGGAAVDPSSGSRIETLLREIEQGVHAFHRASEELNVLGCELKDLDKGLVDFYGLHENEIVYFCWMEGEDQVSHWHTLDSGFKGRIKFEE